MEEEILEVKEEEQGTVFQDGYFVSVFFPSSHKRHRTSRRKEHSPLR